MPKKYVLPLIILVLLPSIVLAQSNDLFDYHALDLKLLIRNDFEIIPTSPNYYLDYVSAELNWYPREDYRQIVDYITTEPRAGFNEETGFLFEWEKPLQTSFSILQESKLTTKNEFRRVSKKIVFPIRDLDPAYSKYLGSQEIIDINDDIRQVASGIVQGEDDLYRAVFKLAEWVEDNVNYNLSTLTAEATQKASWVLENKNGVCDELTSLFISLCRSLGIPARFVSGLSYSNLNLQNNGWGPHGWAEVYFPGFGWVAFDVTYKELGFVDATHIKLKTSLDAKETSVDYATRGRNTDIRPGKLDFDINVIKQDYKVKPVVDLSAEVAEQEVGFDSYNLLILGVKNPHSYYVTTTVSLANVRELEILDNTPKPVLLAPGEEKKLYWMLRVSPDLEPGFIYTFPLKLRTSNEEQAETSFRAAKDWKTYSEEYMKMLIISEQPEEKPYSKKVLITCSPSKEKIYLNETVSTRCVLTNKGDFTLRKLEVCLDNQCVTTKVKGRGSVGFNYTKKFDTLGVKTLVFRVENELVEKSYYTIIEVQDKPLLEIINLSFPKSISYDELSEIKFFVKKKSNTKPRNVKISLKHKFIEEHWDVPSLDRDYQFTVLLRGEYLNLDKNDFKIIINYEDEQGREYKTQEEFSISLNNPTLPQRIMIWLNILEHKIRRWINNI